MLGVADFSNELDLASFVPEAARCIKDPRSDLPRFAKTPSICSEIELVLPSIPTNQRIYNHDSRSLKFIADSSVHLVVTSPPYWTLKEYNQHPSQLGYISDYNEFLEALRQVWAECWRVLVPGGRLICVVGDVCLSRKQNHGEHAVVPLHASITEQCRLMGFTNLAPIIWYKIANARFESQGNGGGFLGKPYEPNAVIKNDIEFILLKRKPGPYRSPTESARVLSLISEDNHRLWFQQIWSGVTGASTRNHPAPYPIELASRLVRMFSFVGDTVLDPFLGTGTTLAAAAVLGRNGVGVELDAEYYEMARDRIHMTLLKHGAGDLSCDQG